MLGFGDIGVKKTNMVPTFMEFVVSEEDRY